ncbi:MAG: OB-fold nucleic acid binding domain-containing protein, partial [Saezia sp.]
MSEQRLPKKVKKQSAAMGDKASNASGIKAAALAATPKVEKEAKPVIPKMTPAQQALKKLGLVRDIDFVLHLPLRYEDETHIIRLRDALHGQTVQVEGEITHQEVVYRGKRQLLVTLQDGNEVLRMRFFSFYPSHLKSLAVGQKVRVRGEIKSGGIWGGWEMMHPAFKVAGGELPSSFTPIYPTMAGLPQAYLRKAIDSAWNRADLSDTVSADLQGLFPQLKHLKSFKSSLMILHQPGPDVSLQ